MSSAAARDRSLEMFPIFPIVVCEIEIANPIDA
jgi:hypothetical protein